MGLFYRFLVRKIDCEGKVSFWAVSSVFFFRDEIRPSSTELTGGVPAFPVGFPFESFSNKRCPNQLNKSFTIIEIVFNH